METEQSSVDNELRTHYKQQAAEAGAEFVQSGMVVGLGTGSTAILAIRHIAHLLNGGKLENVIGFATSKAARDEAQRLGIPMMAEEMPHSIDITIDGADEIDPDVNVIKGGGGALLREKIVAQASRRVIIVADDSKLCSRLGTLHPVPIEVLPFGWRSQFRYIQSLGAKVSIRLGLGGSPFVTDSGNMILDCRFDQIANLDGLAATLSVRAGIIEHGLFLRLATEAVVAGRLGVRHLTRTE